MTNASRPAAASQWSTWELGTQLVHVAQHIHPLAAAGLGPETGDAGPDLGGMPVPAAAAADAAEPPP